METVAVLEAIIPGLNGISVLSGASPETVIAAAEAPAASVARLQVRTEPANAQESIPPALVIWRLVILAGTVSTTTMPLAANSP